jgi:hypothetical protein
MRGNGRSGHCRLARRPDTTLALRAFASRRSYRLPRVPRLGGRSLCLQALGHLLVRLFDCGIFSLLFFGSRRCGLVFLRICGCRQQRNHRGGDDDCSHGAVPFAMDLLYHKLRQWSPSVMALPTAASALQPRRSSRHRYAAGLGHDMTGPLSILEGYHRRTVSFGSKLCPALDRLPMWPDRVSAKCLISSEGKGGRVV